MLDLTAFRTTALVLVAGFALSGFAEASVFTKEGTPDEQRAKIREMRDQTWLISISCSPPPKARSRRLPDMPCSATSA